MVTEKEISELLGMVDTYINYGAVDKAFGRLDGFLRANPQVARARKKLSQLAKDQAHVQAVQTLLWELTTIVRKQGNRQLERELLQELLALDKIHYHALNRICELYVETRTH
jgi:hypothetical protein